MLWLRHWQLDFDPFRPGAVPFVATQEHEDAVARLIHLVENSNRRVDVRGGSGIGKSVVIGEALRRLKRPGRQVVNVRKPADDQAFLRGLLHSLGIRSTPGISRPEAFAHLQDVFRLWRAQGISSVLAVDGDELLRGGTEYQLLDQVDALVEQVGAGVTILTSGRPEGDAGKPWSVRIQLKRMTRQMAEMYLGEKLRAAGRTDPLFSNEAVLRLHAEAKGLPGAIDRLATLLLEVGAWDRNDRVSPDLISDVLHVRQGMLPPALTPN